MNKPPKNSRATRFLRVFFGQLACCHCGQWSPPRRAQGGDRRIWYCPSCGALIAPTSVPFFAELVGFVFMWALSLPLLIALLSLALGKPPFLVWAVVFLGHALACGMTTTYLMVAVWNSQLTRLVEKHGYCLQCGYNLNYSVGNRCSECGAPAVDVREAIVKWKGRGARAVTE